MTSKQKPQTRIQREKTAAIFEAALDVFSTKGFRGATLDEIAEAAGMSKPNLLYYFPSKEAIHDQLLADLLKDWLDPLHQLDPTGDPIEEICAYVERKLSLSQQAPRESRLFANEILRGAVRLKGFLEGELKALVDDKAAVIRGWVSAGRIADIDAHHLIFSIWATTQHYADFDAQVVSVLGQDDPDRFQAAAAFLTRLYREALKPA
ncbi:TetR family transcriptional regulator C-terminal domain-containing protein [Halovulum sp. GXIMD14793]